MISVFGSTGFIGTEFCKQNLCHKVARAINTAPDDTDDILYLIGTTDNYNVLDDVHVDIDTNLTKLVQVLQNIPKNVTFNFISTWFVYGQTELPVGEHSHCNPKGFYSITKRCAEQLVESYCITHSIPYRILRLCNVYGPGDTPSKKKNALQYLINEMRECRDIELYYGGQFFRNYMHVTDVCRAIKLCIDKGDINDIINVGAKESVKFETLIVQAAGEVGYQGIIRSREPSDFHKQIQVKDFKMDVSKLRGLVPGKGFEESISIVDGIKEVCGAL